jgi:streptogramin lyase
MLHRGHFGFGFGLAALAIVVLATTASAQTITYYSIPTANASPSGFTAGPDGNVWFTEAFANQIAVITSAGAITEFKIPTANSLPLGIAAGPDGNLWFSEFNPGQIGRITTAGAVTEFAVPQFRQPSNITAGADGALWFTASDNNNNGSIVRVTTAGSFTTFTPPTSSNLGGITAGPDGALWFTETGANQIGRVTTAGAFTEFPVPTAGSAPRGIVAGPDGALWFTEVSGNQIGRIAQNGTITESALPDPNSLPEGIAAGPDGALWFVDEHGNKLGRVTTTNTSFTGIPVQSNCAPAALVFDAAGNLDFNCTNSSFQGNNVIGSLAAPTPPANVTLSVNAAGAGEGEVVFSSQGSEGPNVCPFNEGTCIQIYPAGTTVTLHAFAVSITNTGAFFESVFAGWSGACGGSTPTCTITLTANATVTATFSISSIPPNVATAAAVLPASRSAQVASQGQSIHIDTTQASDTTATAFATMINPGSSDATGCLIFPTTTAPATFLFQTTNPTPNAPTGAANTPVTIPAGQSQSFVIALTPTAAFAPIDVAFLFGCANAAPATSITGVNTLNLSASTTPVADVVALAASGDPGFVDIPGATGTGDFAVATVNLGADATITAAANTGSATLPVTLTVCQTNPTTGACLAAPAPSATTDIQPDATPTFGIFVTGSGTVADSPGVNRVFVTFTDSGGVLRGETSVAVRTQ